MDSKKKEYEQSDSVKQLQSAYQQQSAQKPGAYQSQWQTSLKNTMDKILNREKFSYDLNGDALYQQYKDKYVQQGKQAMMDTMGQAAAMTGGYGNSYAQSVGQQTYQGYLQGLNDKIPELYQLALDKYNAEGQNLYNQYGLMADQENQDYSRYRDSVSDWNTETERLYNQYLNERSFDYGANQDQIANEQWQAEFDEAKRRYDQEWAEAHPEESSASGGSGGGSGGSGGSGSGYTVDEQKLIVFQNTRDNDGLENYLYSLVQQGLLSEDAAYNLFVKYRTNAGYPSVTPTSSPTVRKEMSKANYTV